MATGIKTIARTVDMAAMARGSAQLCHQSERLHSGGKRPRASACFWLQSALSPCYHVEELGGL